MRAFHWLCPALAMLLAAGCGRIGVRALQIDSGLTEPHIGVDATVAAEGGTRAVDEPPSGGAAGMSGATSDAGVDSGAYAARDAGRDASQDAATGSDAAVDSGPPCGGRVVFGLCWYLGADDTSCSAACANRGGFDSRAIGHIGIPSQGGSLSECTQILTALGRPGVVGEATQMGELGFGCHIWSDDKLYWLSSPAFDPNAKPITSGGAHIACACLE